MWYKIAQQKYNIYGLPISGSLKKVKEFADIDETIDMGIQQIDDIVEEPEEDLEEEITVDDPTPEDDFTPEDLQINIEKIEDDPTYIMKLPPLHDNCRCYIETIPVLTTIGANDGRRIWKKSKECCPICEKSAIEFNNAELMRINNINQS